MTENNWKAPKKPNHYAEESLVNAILDGTFPPGSTLPGERELAAQLGITRPTLREAIQRLARDGWLTVQQGKPTLVNNFWQDGGLNVLSALVQHGQHLPPNFILNLLEIRLHLAPAYIRAAVANRPDLLEELLAKGLALPDTPEAFAAFDWQLHRELTIASGNPIYTLILNGFAGFYEQIARLYFSRPEARALSREFYGALQTAVFQHNPEQAEQIARNVMQQSIIMWQQTKGENHATLERLGR
ncbi:MAG: fatty acid metabolism transcriptional regulator FadR [Chloroflexi bacterium]|nr:MAG: fatty acid metabolism transcriptional regulator FadR [Chloroflexota bacterium]